jgi:glycine/D-amino acid oxidase-like deaminating enzyme
MAHFKNLIVSSSLIDHTIYENKNNCIRIDQIKEITKYLLKQEEYVDKNKKCTELLQNVIYAIENAFILDIDAKVYFQQFIATVGAKTKNFIQMPKESPSFWHLQKTHFNSNNFSSLTSADICIVGLGLTGISAAYHLMDLAKTNKIVILEAEYPGAYSSGRNGGNFQLFPEFATHIKNELIDKKMSILTKKYANIDTKTISKMAHDHAKLLLSFTHNNYVRMRNIVEQHNVNCDYSPAGWLRLASSQDEDELLKNETEWLTSVYDKSIVSLLTKDEIKDMFNFDTDFCARLVKHSGNYDPIKFIYELLNIVQQNGIELYTNTKVLSIDEGDDITILTSNGSIKTKKIIFATNVFTPEIFPELKDKIKCVASQIMNLEHVENNLCGTTCTEKMGRAYYNFPLSTHYDTNFKSYGMLHFGYDFELTDDIPDPRHIEPSIKIYNEMKEITDFRYPTTNKQPPTRVWTGALAFTPDAVPIISFGKSTNIVIIAGFQGFGGSFCIEAGYIGSEMIKTSQYVDTAPETLFGINRFE